MTKGFKILRINKHLSGDDYDVYVFEKSEEIRKEIDYYIKAKGEIYKRVVNERNKVKTTSNKY